MQGLGVEPALARSVCELGAIPGALLGNVPPGVAVPLGPGVACVVGESGLVHADHVDVHARRLVPHPRQPVVPLGVRRQRRGRDGTGPLRAVLSVVRHRRRARAHRVEPGQRRARRRCVGRDRRRDGRVRGALSARAGAHARRARLLLHAHRRARLSDARLLVPAPGPRRHSRAAGRGRRRRVLGARRRVRRRDRAAAAVPGSRRASRPIAATSRSASARDR